MSKQNIPDENRMEELLGKIQPVPSERFHQQMRQSTLKMEKREQTLTVYRLKVSAGILLVFLVILFVTPQGRAWAQELFHFFSRINAQAVEIPESQLKLMEESMSISYDLPLVPLFIPTVSPEMAVLPGCETPEKAQSYRCQVALAESKMGVNLKELPATPENWKFEYLYFDAASKHAMISYIMDQKSPASGSFLLTQGVGDFPTDLTNTPWEAVPADKVESVKINEYNGEYVKGSFGMPVDKTLTWSDSYIQRLAWSDGARWYMITLRPSPTVSDLMSRDKLIELAESLVDSPKETTQDLDPDALYSISDAEQVSGIDLKAPTLLPLDIDFAYARYDSYKVHLFYGINNEMVIHVWKDKSLNFDPRATYTSYEIVKINGEPAFYGSAGGKSDGHMFLSWDLDGTLYQIHYSQYFGPTIEKEELIAIAESMQDINDFRKWNSKPYEYVSIYEQALGLDVKEFPEMPNQWLYGSVFGDPLGRCIGLFYKSITESGLLFINQCGTDRYFDVSDIPSRHLERVQIGNITGMYAAGDFVTQDNGELAWNPDVPVKRLYWQEGKLWIEVNLYGESASRYTKENLISYAESLR